jgi:tetratricopeptide (TPR) repeat protein
MPIRDRIRNLLDLIEQEAQQVIASLSEADRHKVGMIDHWAPKEVLCHIAGWTQRQLDNIHSAYRGGEPVKYPNFLELNDEDFQEYRKLSWEQSVLSFKAAHQAARELLDEVSEADLLRDDLIPSDPKRTLWHRIVDNAVDHTTLHLAYIHYELGDPVNAAKFQERIANLMVDLAPEDQEWAGIVGYNLACAYALSSQKEKAIEGLKKALKLNPGLTEWSKEDSDFASIREEAGYLAIYQG